MRNSFHSICTVQVKKQKDRQTDRQKDRQTAQTVRTTTTDKHTYQQTATQAPTRTHAQMRVSITNIIYVTHTAFPIHLHLFTHN